MNNGVIFPGCGVAYLGNEKDTLLSHSKDLEGLYLKAKQVVDIDEALFNAAHISRPDPVFFVTPYFLRIFCDPCVFRSNVTGESD